MAPRRGIDHADGYSLERTEVGTLRMRRQLAKTRDRTTILTGRALIVPKKRFELGTRCASAFSIIFPIPPTCRSLCAPCLPI